VIGRDLLFVDEETRQYRTQQRGHADGRKNLLLMGCKALVRQVLLESQKRLETGVRPEETQSLIKRRIKTAKQIS